MNNMENLVRELRDKLFILERYEGPPTEERLDWHTYHREKEGRRDKSNELAKEVWDMETEQMIEEYRNEPNIEFTWNRSIYLARVKASQFAELSANC